MLIRRVQSGLTKQTAGPFASLRVRDFRYLLMSATSLQFGQWFQQVGMGWLVYVVTNDPVQMGVVAAFRGVALIVASVPAGLLADRLDRRTMVLWATGVAATQATILAALVLLDVIQWWHLWVFAIVEGMSTAFNQPAQFALIYDKVGPKTLENAVALNAVTFNLTRITGPTIAGVIIAWRGPAICFLTLAALKLLALVLITRVRPAPVAPDAGSKGYGWRSYAQGLVAVGRSRVLIGLLVAHVLPTILVYPYMAFIPLYTSEVLGFVKDASAYGLLISANGFGSLVGSVLLTAQGSRGRGGKLMLGGMFLYMLMMIMFSRATSLPWAFAFLAVGGLGNSFNMALNQALYQLHAPREIQGRAMAVYGVSATGLQPLGNLLMGTVISFWGFPNTLTLLAGTAALATAFLTVAMPHLWTLRAPVVEAQKEA